MSCRNVNIMSKVSPSEARRLDAIVQTYGFRSKYEVLQYLLSAFIRYADCETDNAGDIPVEVKRIFETVKSDARFGLVKPGTSAQLRRIICIYGTDAISADVCRGRITKTTTNVAKAYDSVARLSPTLNTSLKKICTQYDMHTYMEASVFAAEKMNMQRDADEISEEIREQNEELSSADKHVRFGVKPKRAKHYGNDL